MECVPQTAWSAATGAVSAMLKVCRCVFECGRESEQEREKKKEKERKRERERESESGQGHRSDLFQTQGVSESSTNFA